MPAIKDLILSVPSRSDRKPVTVPEWPGTEGKLFVRPLTAREREAYDYGLTAFLDGKAPLWKVRTVVAVLVDENGNQIFGDGDVEKLAAGSPEPIDRVFGFWSEAFKAPSEGDLGKA